MSQSRRQQWLSTQQDVTSPCPDNRVRNGYQISSQAKPGALRILSLLNWSKLYSQSIYSDCLNMQTSQNVKIVEPDSSKWYNLAFYIYKNIGIKSIFPCATRLNTRVGCHSSSPVSAESIQQGHKGNICGFQGNSRTNFPAPL